MTKGYRYIQGITGLLSEARYTPGTLRMLITIDLKISTIFCRNSNRLSSIFLNFALLGSRKHLPVLFQDLSHSISSSCDIRVFKLFKPMFDLVYIYDNFRISVNPSSFESIPFIVASSKTFY